MTATKRLIFNVGDRVVVMLTGDVCNVQHVLHGEVKPYLLSNGELVGVDEITSFQPKYTWEEAERELVNAVNKVRDKFNKMNISTVRVAIVAEGNTAGDLVFKYSVGRSAYDAAGVSGGDLSQCVDEYERRDVWNERHAARQLAYSDSNRDALDEEVPF